MIGFNWDFNSEDEERYRTQASSLKKIVNIQDAYKFNTVGI